MDLRRNKKSDSCISIKDTEFLIKTFPVKKTPSPGGFTGELSSI